MSEHPHKKSNYNPHCQENATTLPSNCQDNATTTLPSTLPTEPPCPKHQQHSLLGRTWTKEEKKEKTRKQKENRNKKHGPCSQRQQGHRPATAEPPARDSKATGLRQQNYSVRDTTKRRKKQNKTRTSIHKSRSLRTDQCD